MESSLDKGSMSRDPEEVQDDGMHDHTDGIEHEAIE